MHWWQWVLQITGVWLLLGVAGVVLWSAVATSARRPIMRRVKAVNHNQQAEAACGHHRHNETAQSQRLDQRRPGELGRVQAFFARMLQPRTRSYLNTDRLILVIGDALLVAIVVGVFVRM